MPPPPPIPLSLPALLPFPTFTSYLSAFIFIPSPFLPPISPPHFSFSLPAFHSVLPCDFVFVVRLNPHTHTHTRFDCIPTQMPWTVSLPSHYSHSNPIQDCWKCQVSKQVWFTVDVVSVAAFHWSKELLERWRLNVINLKFTFATSYGGRESYTHCKFRKHLQIEKTGSSVFFAILVFAICSRFLYLYCMCCQIDEVVFFS